MEDEKITPAALAMMMMALDGNLPLPYALTKYTEAESYICKNCQKEFKAIGHNRKTFCSAECYKTYYRDKIK